METFFQFLKVFFCNFYQPGFWDAVFSYGTLGQKVTSVVLAYLMVAVIIFGWQVIKHVIKNKRRERKVAMDVKENVIVSFLWILLLFFGTYYSLRERGQDRRFRRVFGISPQHRHGGYDEPTHKLVWNRLQDEASLIKEQYKEVDKLRAEARHNPSPANINALRESEKEAEEMKKRLWRIFHVARGCWMVGATPDGTDRKWRFEDFLKPFGTKNFDA